MNIPTFSEMFDTVYSDNKEKFKHLNLHNKTNTQFLLPLEYLFQQQQNYTKTQIIHPTDTQMLNDLECNIDSSNNFTPYSIIFESDNQNQNQNQYQNIKLNWHKYYSSDISLINQIKTFILNVSITNDDTNNADDERNIKCSKDGFCIRTKNNNTNDERNNNVDVDSDERNNNVDSDERNNNVCDYSEWDKFIQKYTDEPRSFYSDFSLFEMKNIQFLNNYPFVLQLMTTYNFISPALQLIMPLFMLFIPFFIIKFLLKKNISISLYKTILWTQLQNHSIGKIFTAFSPNASTQTRITALGIFFFFIYSVYQNIKSCIKFYKNISLCYKVLNHLRIFTDKSLNINNHIITSLQNTIPNKQNIMNSYLSFLREKHNDMVYLKSLIHDCNFISLNVKNITHIGKKLHILYQIYNNQREIIRYMIELQTFQSNCQQLRKTLHNSLISSCSFSLNDETNLSDVYYPFLLLQNERNERNQIVYNDYNTQHKEKVRFISGPNASGKTTYIKTILISLLFSQQFGFGFYKNAVINPYHKFHCYLSIPDTSGRDSLFQAEARRCLDIIHSLQSNHERNKNFNNHNRHFAIFDELFSGTNTTEAVDVAYQYLKYISKYNITSLLTTHFHNLIDKSKSEDYMYSYKMDVDYSEEEKDKNTNDNVREKNTNDDDDNDNNNVREKDIKYLFNYKYTISKGISNIHGAKKVLIDLGYPSSIIKQVSK